MNNLTLKKKPLIYTFWGLAGLTFTWRVFEQDSLNLIFTPLLSLILIYGLSLSLTCAMGLAVYWHKKTTPTLHFAKGLVILSVTASLIGINRFYLKNSLVYGVETLLNAPSLFYIFMYFKTKTQRAL